jgi:catechol 2,3-dioxygenase-like lactoylglutathione lyase family enzyme
VLELDHIQIAMPSGREDDARRFYGDVLGLEEIEKPVALKARGGVWFQLGHHGVHLGVEEAFSPARKAHPGVACLDVESLAERLQGAGYMVNWDSNLPGRKRFYTEDPFGNRLEFFAASPPL